MNPRRDHRSRYVMFLPWAPTFDAGVNNVIRGISGACDAFYEPVVVVTSSKKPENYGGPWLYLPYPNPLRPFGFLARMIPVMLRLRAILKNAVAANPHFGGLECISLVILRRLGLGPKVIMSIHGADVTEILESRGWERKAYRWLFSSADLVVGCSRDIVGRMLEFCPSANATAIWNAATHPPDIPVERPFPRSYLLCVAAFVAKKAHEVLLTAFVEIHRQHPELDLVLVGCDGPTRPAIEKAIADLGLTSCVRIVLDRPNAEVWWWMRHAECFVLPSREEPFGIVLLEAGKSKIPIVATRVGGIPEFVTDGEDGLLCEPDQPDQLTEAVLLTLADREATARRVDAFSRKAGEFTWPNTFARYRSAAHLP